MKRELELMLGARLDALVGIECNLYFEGLLPHVPTEDRELSVSCEFGRHLSDRWSFTPEKAHTGVHPLTISYRDPHSRERVSASCKVHVHDASPGSFHWLPIGDSITNAARYLQAARERAAGLGIVLETQGTRCAEQAGGVRHEGYPGWKFGDFLGPDCSTRANFQDLTASAFSFGGEPHFDFERYRKTRLAGREPGFVTIFLGTNDIALLDDATRTEGVRAAILHAETLAEAILKHTGKTKLGFIPPLTPAGQDAFGLNYGCLIPRWLYRKNQHALVQAIQEKFAVFHERVSCISAHLGIDPFYGYPLREEKVNACSEQLRSINSNAVHPSPSGHRQIADSVLAWMIGRFSP